MSDWTPELYLRFSDERTRAARDLLAQVPLTAARRVYDLGCGPGNSTALLVARFPEARVTGVDNSPAMLTAARKAMPDADYEDGDLALWRPKGVPELLFANAAFQWVPRHLDHLERLARHLPAGGVLAVQMPDNLDEPSHALMRETAMNGPWTEQLREATAARGVLPPAGTYYRRLKPFFRHLDVWHSIYNHPLDGVRGITAMLSSTGLRPFMALLDEASRAGFIAAYEERLARAYPVMPDGTVLLRLPRLFIVGVV
jgi:trans-aconitate 2-methyltransferase